MRMRRLAQSACGRAALALVALAALLTWGCSCGKNGPQDGDGEKENQDRVTPSGDETATKRPVVEETDVLGSVLRLDAYPERIVSAAPSNTEIVLQLGCRDRLIGVSMYYGSPELVKGIARVGGYYDPNIETILALEPDLVLVARGVSREILDKMRAFKLPVFCLDTQDLDGLYRDIAIVGRLLGVEESATALIEQTRNGIAEVTEKTERLDESERPRVFWLGQEEPLMTAGPGNMIDTLFALAGGANVAADAPSAWPTYSFETLLVKDPEVIVAAKEGLMGREEDPAKLLKRLRAHRVWSRVSAVKTGRIYIVPTDLIGQPTPRVVEGLRIVAGCLHPELFEASDDQSH
jgi:iron complex transport system substrate-binding protein